MATVRRCIDCDAMLVDGTGPESEGEAVPSAGAPVGAGEQIGYELEGWGNQLKVTLEGMLARADIGRVWEAGALVVSSDDEEAVDDLIATLEGGDVAELDDETPRVALEIEGMDADDQAELDAQLLAGSVPHAWDDEGALIVAEADEDRVLAVIDEVLDGPPAGGDGLAAQNALSALYVAVDRLVKSPHDRKLATAYVRAAAELDGLDVPYGFAAAEWSDLADEADRLADDVADHADVAPEPADPDDEGIAPLDADDDDDEALPTDDDAEEHGEPGGSLDADADDTDTDTDTDADDDASPTDDTDDTDTDTGTGDETEPGPDDHDEAAEDGDTSDSVTEARDAARRLRARLADLV